MTTKKGRTPGINARTAYKLAKLLLGQKETERRLEEQTRLSRFLGKDPLYKYLDVLYHYPAFLFHDSPEQRALREEFGDDYRHSLDLLLRSGFGTRNLGARLRAFRMQHDLTLIETADLLDLSKSELHRLERAERRPSPRTRYRILRLLTLPLPESLETRKPKLEKRTGRISVHQCASVVPILKALLSLPPPDSSTVRLSLTVPSERRGTLGLFDPSNLLGRLRHLWLARIGLAGRWKTRELAAVLGVSPPHLIRLLRGDRRPSKKLTERLESLLGTAH